MMEKDRMLEVPMYRSRWVEVQFLGMMVQDVKSMIRAQQQVLDMLAESVNILWQCLLFTSSKRSRWI